MILINRVVYKVSHIHLPSVDINNYLTRNNHWQADCRQVSSLLKQFGLLYVKDSRVDQSKNETFFDLMERYFEKRSQQYKQGFRDIDLAQNEKYAGFQHCFADRFLSFKQQKSKLKGENQCLTPQATLADPVWRFRWIMNYDKNVKPKDFPQFQEVMHSWCSYLRNTTLTVAEMTAIGFGLQRQAFTDYFDNGDIYFAPTGIDLRDTKVGDVITSYHHDWDIFTAHSKSNFPGLYAWTKTGQKFPVVVPEGHLLLQAGEQLEWLTGGEIKAGFHEVIHNQKAQERKIARMKANKSPWRVSSVVFNNVEGSKILEPLPQFRSKQADRLYPSITAEKYLKERFQEAVIQQNS